MFSNSSVEVFGRRLAFILCAVILCSFAIHSTLNPANAQIKSQTPSQRPNPPKVQSAPNNAPTGSLPGFPVGAFVPLPYLTTGAKPPNPVLRPQPANPVAFANFLGSNSGNNNAGNNGGFNGNNGVGGNNNGFGTNGGIQGIGGAQALGGGATNLPTTSGTLIAPGVAQFPQI